MRYSDALLGMAAYNLFFLALIVVAFLKSPRDENGRSVPTDLTGRAAYFAIMAVLAANAVAAFAGNWAGWKTCIRFTNLC